MAGLAAVALWLGLEAGLGALSLHAQEQPGSYTVVAGDTLSSIAARFGVPLEVLIVANAVEDPALIRVGQVLVIPGAGATAGVAAVNTAVVHALPGETLGMLAARTAQEAQTLTALNQISATVRLFPGQPVAVPRTQAPVERLRFGAVSDVQMPDRLLQGRTGVLTLTSSRPLSPTAAWNGLPLVFTPMDGDPLRQYALIPTPALLEPNAYPLSLGYATRSGVPITMTWSISVQDGGYASQVIDVPQEKSNLLDPAVVQAELEKVTAVWSQVSAQPLWATQFSRPIGADYATTSPFGVRRVYSAGDFSGYHAGQDFGAPEGTPVVAPAPGIVALAESLTVRGGAVILDHGRGVFTGYWHLSELKVTPGQVVNTGDVIGLVGNTGLSTGAHLHWELRIYGVAVDPMPLLDTPLAPIGQ